MKTARFNIRKMTSKGSTFWAIFLPPWINPSGKKGYAYFHTKAEAERKRGELIAATRSESKLMVLTNAESLCSLANALGVSMDWLWGRDSGEYNTAKSTSAPSTSRETLLESKLRMATSALESILKELKKK